MILMAKDNHGLPIVVNTDYVMFACEVKGEPGLLHLTFRDGSMRWIKDSAKGFYDALQAHLGQQ